MHGSEKFELYDYLWTMASYDDDGGVIGIHGIIERSNVGPREGTQSDAKNKARKYIREQLNTESGQYADEINDFANLAKVGSTQINLNSNNELGPFKIKFGGANVRDIIIKGDNTEIAKATVIESEEWVNAGETAKERREKTSSYWFFGANLKKYTKSETGLKLQIKTTGSWKNLETDSNGCYKIPNNTNFYLKVVNGDLSGYNKINVTIGQKKLPVYRARMILIGSMETVQQKLAFAILPDGQIGEDLSYEIDQAKAKLNIVKQDYDNNNTKLNDAKFKVFKKGSGWLGYNTTSKKVEYGKTFAQAAEFLTGTSYCDETATTGYIKLRNLQSGTYYAFETTTPTGYTMSSQSGYESSYTNTTLFTNNNWKITGGCILCGGMTLTNTGEGTITVANKKDVGLTITKTDYDNTNTKLKDVGFKILVKATETNSNLGSTNNAWGWLKSDGKVSANFNDANEFKTNNSGQIVISNIPYGIYYIYETSVADTNYSLSGQAGYKSAKPNGYTGTFFANNVDYVYIGSKTLTASSRIQSISATNRKNTSLTLSKTDFDNTNTKLSNVGFKVLVKSTETNTNLGSTNNTWGWLKSDGKVSTNFSDAYEFKTDTKGTKTINNIPYGVYYIYETTAASGYTLNVQDKYKETKPSGYNGTFFATTTDYVYLGTKTITKDARAQTLDAKNKKLIHISGYVWQDEPDGKNGSMVGDKKYDTKVAQDKKIQGVTVYLKNKSDDKNVSGIVSNPVTTGSDGIYKFEKVNANKLNDYYIEFDYSSSTAIKIDNKVTNIKQYIPVEIDSTTATNTSKALKYDLTSDAYPTADTDLTGKATTYRGRPNTNTIKENTYGLSHFYGTTLYSSTTNTLSGINLGLKPVFDPEFRIEQDIAYAKIKYNEYEYKYVYGGTGTPSLENTPTVNWAGTRTYSRDIYPSEILASKASDKNKLSVNIVYRIMVKNTSNYNVPDIYVEDKLIVNSLTESIGTENASAPEYEFNKKDINNTYDAITKEHFDDWHIQKDGKTLKYIGTEFNGGIGPGNTKSVYVQFKLTGDTLNKVLKGEKPNVKDTARISAYHEYKRNDYGWFNSSTDTNKLKKTNQSHRTPDKSGYAIAHGMTFKLPDNGKERTISGTVFVDNATTNKLKNNELIGNGKKDSRETTIKDVEVQLCQKIGSGDTIVSATRYPKDKTDGITSSIKTKEGGTYSFDGVVPGEYLIRFKYGDETYNVEKYKSTIISWDSAKNAFENGENKHGSEWYKFKDSGTNAVDRDTYSVAVDDLSTRQKINNNENIRSMTASTPIVSITIENTIGKEATAINNTGATVDTTKNSFGGFNLGIIEAPQPTANIEKVISNVKLTNAQQNVLFDGNPEKNTDMAGVSDLDSRNNGGSTYTRMELNADSIYGSTIQLTYTIKITNTSKKNYVEVDKEHFGWYYLYGETGDYSRGVTLNIDESIDYLDPTVKYEGISKVSNVKELSKVGPEWKDSDNNAHNLSGKVNTGLSYKKLLAIMDFGTLKTGENRDFTIKTSRVLSNEDDDMEILNDIEIAQMTKKIAFNAEDEDSKKTQAEESLKLVRKPLLPDPAEARATITPPTGENRNIYSIYIITGTVALIILATGVVIIKKKVL